MPDCENPWYETMYHIEQLDQTLVSGALGSLVANVLRGLAHDLLDALDHMNRATAEGKALDQIQEQLISFPGVEDVLVDQSAPVRLAVDCASLLVVAAETLAPETHSQMNHVLITVNKRYGTDIRARAVVR